MTVWEVGRLDAGSAYLPLNRTVGVSDSGTALTTTGFLDFGHDGTGTLNP